MVAFMVASPEQQHLSSADTWRRLLAHATLNDADAYVVPLKQINALHANSGWREVNRRMVEVGETWKRKRLESDPPAPSAKKQAT